MLLWSVVGVVRKLLLACGAVDACECWCAARRFMERVLSRRLTVWRCIDLVQNLAPGAASRLGFSSAELRKEFPSLITVDISGYGEAGPRRNYKAYDLLVCCRRRLDCRMLSLPQHDPRRVASHCIDGKCRSFMYAPLV